MKWKLINYWVDNFTDEFIDTIDDLQKLTFDSWEEAFDYISNELNILGVKYTIEIDIC